MVPRRPCQEENIIPDVCRAGMVCGMLHPYIPYYNRAAALAYTASGVASGIWYALEVLRRCDTLQRGAGGVISAFAGLVLYAVKWVKLPETHL